MAFNPAKRLGAKKDGGGGRTRTCEAMRRLIYSQLPLPLGTLPRSTAVYPRSPRRAPTDQPWRGKDRDNPALSRARGPARLWAKRPGKVNRRPRSKWVVFDRNCHCPEPVTEALVEILQ